MQPSLTDRIAPELRVPFLPRSGPIDPSRLSWARRLMPVFAWLAARNLPKPDQIVFSKTCKMTSADGRALLKLRVHRPSSQTGAHPAMLWIHGGGYMMGSAAADDALCRLYAARAGLTVVAVDYRLAPEHPFPTPLEDCYSAFAWMLQHAAELQIDPARIAVGGASAGGGLAASLALLARERGGIQPAFQLLNYPMLDDRTTAPAAPHLGEWIWGASANRSGWTAYLGNTAPDAALVPARATSLAQLPPAWLGCGALDLFHPENEAYARRLTDSGVACEWTSVPGAYHGFDTSAPRAEVCKAYLDSQVSALRKHLVTT